MMRICPSLGPQDTSESMSFLKVDPRKKQLTLYDPTASAHSNSGHRRPAVAAPKMFAFDAVFTQDASQVSAADTPQGRGEGLQTDGWAGRLSAKTLILRLGHSLQFGPGSWAF